MKKTVRRAALLALLWLLVKRCQEYRTAGIVSRVFSVLLCGALALGCLWGGVRQELNRLPLLQEKPVRPDEKDS